MSELKQDVFLLQQEFIEADLEFDIVEPLTYTVPKKYFVYKPGLYPGKTIEEQVVLTKELGIACYVQNTERLGLFLLIGGEDRKCRVYSSIPTPCYHAFKSNPTPDNYYCIESWRLGDGKTLADDGKLLVEIIKTRKLNSIGYNPLGFKI